MSEYQYYEFRAIDRALTKDETAALRRISTRAEITSHGFVNHYEWGDLKADPLDMIEKYFDAFVYVTNWGTHRFAVRLPRADVDVAAWRQYTAEYVFEVHERGPVVIFDFSVNDDAGVVGDWEGDEEWMPDLVAVREGIARGDLRAGYLAWLIGTDDEDLAEDAEEPPVPAGLTSLPPELDAFARFIRVPNDLLTVAALVSEETPSSRTPPPGIEAWVRRLPEAEKTALLVEVIGGAGGGVGARLLRRFGRETAPPVAAPSRARRTVGDLLAAAEAVTTERERIAAEQRAKAEAERMAKEAAARTAYLDGLARRVDSVWRDIENLATTKKPGEYDRAVRLVTDLRDVADRDGDIDEFWARLRGLRERHAKKVSFIGRLDEAGLEG